MKDSRVDVLRRIAFGRDSTADERAAAIEELRKLEEARTAPAHEVDGENYPSGATEPATGERADSAVCDTTGASDSNSLSARADVPETRQRTLVRAIWLVPVILVSLALGALGGTLWGPPQLSTTKPAPRASFALGTDGSGQPGGDLVAADNRFYQPQTAQDVFPLPHLVQNLSQLSVRFLGGTSDSVQLWVGRNTEDELCLLAYEKKTKSGAASCATPTNFTSHGITLGFNQYQVSWDGAKFTVFTPYGT